MICLIAALSPCCQVIENLDELQERLELEVTAAKGGALSREAFDNIVRSERPPQSLPDCPSQFDTPP